MPITAENLAIQLSQDKHKLMPAYIVAGQEMFIAIEVVDLLTNKLKQQGYSEREVYYINTRFDFNLISDSLQAMSLFATQKIVEIRFETDKLTKKDAESLLKIIKKPSKHIVIIQAVNLSYKVQKENYFTELCKHAELINCPVIYPNKLISWIATRIKNRNLNVTADVIKLIHDAAHGNLFWCHQLIEQLQFIDGAADKLIDAQMVKNILSDQSVFHINDLTTSLFNKSPTAKKILEKIKENNESPILINAIICKDIEILIALQSNSSAHVFSQYKVWQSKQAFYSQVSNNFDLATLNQAMSLLAELDKASKGVSKQDEWLLLENLVCLLVNS